MEITSPFIPVDETINEALVGVQAPAGNSIYYPVIYQ